MHVKNIQKPYTPCKTGTELVFKDLSAYEVLHISEPPGESTYFLVADDNGNFAWTGPLHCQLFIKPSPKEDSP